MTMTDVVIRQSGGAEIVSIPKAIGRMLGLHPGSRLSLSVVDRKIVLTPIEETSSLEELLANSPRECFRLSEEDEEWMNDAPVGKESL